MASSTDSPTSRVTTTSTGISTTRVTSISTDFSTTRVTSTSSGILYNASDFYFHWFLDDPGDRYFERNLCNASDLYLDRLLDDTGDGHFNRPLNHDLDWYLDDTGHWPVHFDDLWLTGWQDQQYYCAQQRRLDRD